MAKVLNRTQTIRFLFSLNNFRKLKLMGSIRTVFYKFNKVKHGN